jgi:hypothetical protein
MFGRTTTSQVEGVAVAQGMPALLFSGTVLHELGHAWLTVHGVEKLPLWASEGFCELLAHRYYSDQSTPEARFYLKQQNERLDPIYGDGFRTVRALSDRLGFANLVEALHTTKRLPA